MPLPRAQTGEKDNLKKKKSASGLTTSFLLNSFHYVTANSIIFYELHYFQNVHSSKLHKASSLSGITNSLIPTAPSPQTSSWMSQFCQSQGMGQAKYGKGAKEEKFAECPQETQNRWMQHAQMRPCMETWQRNRWCWKPGQSTVPFYFKGEQKGLSLNGSLGLLSPLQVIKENCKPAEVRHSLKGPKTTEDVSV